MKRLLALLLALLTLSGCAAVLEREYLVTAEHVESSAGQPAGAYRVERYAALMNALDSYVEEAWDSGVLRFPTTYPGDLTVDMEKARRQMMEEHPLGAYALEDMSYHISRAIAYYEVELTFSYRVEKEAVTGLRQVDEGELETLFRDTLLDFGPGFTARLMLGEGGREAVQAALDRAYDSVPEAALGRPTLDVTLYPENGPDPVGEVTLTYDRPTYQLYRERDNLKKKAEELALETEGTPQAILAALRELCTYDPEGGSTAASALLEGRADSEGMALAYRLLCVLKEVPCAISRTGTGCVAQVTAAGEPVTVDFAQAEPWPLPEAEEEGEDGT